MDSDDERLFSKIKSDFSCAICLSLLKDAIMTPCGHLFCSECLRSWVQSIFPEIMCPKCRSLFKMEETIRSYNGTSSKPSRHNKFYTRCRMHIKEFPFACRTFGSILLYEGDFTDSLSLKSTLFLIFTFSLSWAAVLFLIHY